MKKILLALLFGLFVVQAFAQKDTVIVSNGDQLVGELKSLSRKVMSFDTDYADSEFQVDWDKVSGITTVTQVIVYTDHNKRLVGHINYDSTKSGKVLIVTDSGVELMDINDIVSIETLDNKFWDRVSISIGAGFSYTKANNVTQFTTSGTFGYANERWSVAGSFNGLVASQDSVETSVRNEGDLTFNRDIAGWAYGFIGIELLESTEQNLDLRTTTKLGVGMYFIRRNGFLFQGGVGLANTNENYGAPDNNTENTFEGLLVVNADAYDIGDFSIAAGSTLYPSLSSSGRVRINSNISCKWDMPLDFYIKASFVHNYDSDPQTSGVDKGDYVFQTSIGWEWN